MIYLNALSITSIDTLIENQDSLKQSLEFLSLIEDKFLLCVPFNNPGYIIQNNTSLKQAISKITDLELKSLLTTILTSSTSYLGEYPKTYLHQGKNEYFNAFETYLSMNNEECMILSIHSENYWVDNLIQLIGNGVTNNYFNCPSVNCNTFIESINVWSPLIKKIVSKKTKKEGFLCHALSLKKLIPKEIYNQYINELNIPDCKISNIRAMARLIAECCEYQFMLDISNRNRNGSVIRDIYFNSENRQYLSTDINHGRFEVLDNNGNHICEINFEGTQTKPRDLTGQHNIRI